MAWKVDRRESEEVEVGKLSTMLPGEVLERLLRTEERFSGPRAKRATARFP